MSWHMQRYNDGCYCRVPALRMALPSAGIKRQQGVVLIIALVFLLLLTLIGVTAMQGTSQEEKMSSNVQQQTEAFQAAEGRVARWRGVPTRFDHRASTH